MLQTPRARFVVSSAWSDARNRAMRAYGLACVASAIALVTSLAVSPVDADDSVAALLFIAVVGLSGSYGGLGPALLAAAVGTLAIDYFFETPPYTLQITSERTVLDLASFLLVAVFLGWLHDRLRAERDRSRRALDGRDELLASVSDELRRPLSAIKASVYSLYGDQIRQLAPEARERLLTVIESESERLASFVTAALAKRQLEDGQDLHRQTTTAADVASAVLDRYLPSLGPRPVHFDVDGTTRIRIDARLLDQALSALLENVSVHTPPETAVGVEGRLSGRDLQLSVCDAGPGIPPAARERIFAKYVRLDEAKPGVGLGLTIARAAVEAQGGRIWVQESSVGGACFVVVIPNAAVRPY